MLVTAPAPSTSTVCDRCSPADESQPPEALQIRTGVSLGIDLVARAKRLRLPVLRWGGYTRLTVMVKADLDTSHRGHGLKQWEVQPSAVEVVRRYRRVATSLGALVVQEDELASLSKKAPFGSTVGTIDYTPVDAPAANSTRSAGPADRPEALAAAQ